MIKELETTTNGILSFITEWEPTLLNLSDDAICERRNSQNRTIKQIVGHMIDSASNNTHRIVHLQYCESPLIFPNYATNGNNDRWIAIQNYQDEDWTNMVQLWKYSHLHLVHIIKNVHPEKLESEWISDIENHTVTLKAMILDFLRHLQLHLNEVNALLK